MRRERGILGYTTKMQKDEYFTHTKTYYLLLATCYRIIHIRIFWTMDIPVFPFIDEKLEHTKIDMATIKSETRRTAL